MMTTAEKSPSPSQRIMITGKIVSIISLNTMILYQWVQSLKTL